MHPDGHSLIFPSNHIHNHHVEKNPNLVEHSGQKTKHNAQSLGKINSR